MEDKDMASQLTMQEQLLGLDEEESAAALSQTKNIMNISLDFIKAGKAIFTVDNGKGTHYTFKVTKKDPEVGSKWEKYGPSFFIGLLTGPDNTSDFTYMGMLKWEGGRPICKLTKASKFQEETTAVQVMNFALRVAWGSQQLPDGYSIRHAGLCGRCARQLTDPVSLELGLGPICRGED
jgi:hypothetical protein